MRPPDLEAGQCVARQEEEQHDALDRTDQCNGHTRLDLDAGRAVDECTEEDGGQNGSGGVQPAEERDDDPRVTLPDRNVHAQAVVQPDQL